MKRWGKNTTFGVKCDDEYFYFVFDCGWRKGQLSKTIHAYLHTYIQIGTCVRIGFESCTKISTKINIGIVFKF